MWIVYIDLDQVYQKKCCNLLVQKSQFCRKGHDNWSTWTSTNNKIHRYCKTCRQNRAKKYSQRKKNAKGYHTKEEWEQKKKEYKACPRCKRPWKEIRENPSKGKAKYTITKDHIIPLLQGGTDDIENIQPLCYQCNFKKGHS